MLDLNFGYALVVRRRVRSDLRSLLKGLPAAYAATTCTAPVGREPPIRNKVRNSRLRPFDGVIGSTLGVLVYSLFLVKAANVGDFSF